MIPVWMQAGLIPTAGVPSGQIQWTIPGTYQWTVPVGVKSVSCLAVAAGRSGYVAYVSYNNLGYRGYGGLAPAYVYRNDVAVTPGQVLTIVVGSGGTNASGAGAATQDGGGLSSVLGLVSRSDSGSSTYGPANGLRAGSDSGNAAHPAYTSNASGRGVDLKTGLPTTRTNNEGAPCGGGGSAGFISGTQVKFKGGDGGVRIVWGEGRRFPDNALDVQ